VAEEAIQVVVLPIAEVGSPWCYAALYWHIQVSVIELHSPTDDVEGRVRVIPKKIWRERDLFRKRVRHGYRWVCLRRERGSETERVQHVEDLAKSRCPPGKTL
jgi:hypothetical protein